MPGGKPSRMYRPVPRNFRETFIRVGWAGIEQEMHAHARSIKRWMEIVGREALIEARADYVRRHGYNRRDFDARMENRL